VYQIYFFADFCKENSICNCRIAASYMDKAGFKYEKLMADEHAELAKSYGVKQAPTLIVPTPDGFEKYAGAGAIKNFVVQ